MMKLIFTDYPRVVGLGGGEWLGSIFLNGKRRVGSRLIRIFCMVGLAPGYRKRSPPPKDASDSDRNSWSTPAPGSLST